MSTLPSQDLQAKQLVLKMSAIITILSLCAAFSAQHFGLPQAYSYCVGGLGIIGATLHAAVRFGLLKPQPLQQNTDENRSKSPVGKFWLTRFMSDKRN